MATVHTLFAPVPLGLEAPLAEELRALRAGRVRERRAGVSFLADLEGAARVLMWSRVASRVLLRIAEVDAPDPDTLYAAVRELAWEEHVPVDGTLAVDVVASRSPISHTGYAALKVKDAIVDRLRDRFGRRPSVDTERPDVRVNVALRGKRATVSIDLAGDGLHRRGYRAPGEQVVAPLKENLAAGVLALAGWPRRAEEGGAFCDPMCGAGTLVIEAACVACDIAPGLGRAYLGVHGWLGRDDALWERLVAEARERAEAGIAAALGTGAAVPRFLGSDTDGRALALATASAGRAGLARVVRFEKRDALRARPPASSPGLVAFNPPYGERLGAEEIGELRALYSGVGARLREAFAEWDVCVVTAAVDVLPLMGLDIAAEHATFNGRIPVTVAVGRAGRVGTLSDRTSATSGTPATPSAPGHPPATPESEGVRQLANRLRKNVRHLGKWARRADITCYRIYDADLAEYALAVDVYHGAGPDEGRTLAHIAEYAPPDTVAPELARRRLTEAHATVADTLGIDPADVYLKVRTRQRGTAQYERQAAERRTLTVAEGGLLFEVNLSDYLDTGLFLDHRITRGMVRDAASGTRFLNLFAYTGTATVYAASGGAASTTTIDMSQNYLDWAARNMARNAFEGRRHTRVRADVLAWLDSPAARSAGPFDLVFCDPPTFSNSKRMDGTFDVQRDHADLIGRIVPLMAPGGTLLFSTNRKRFAFDADSLAAAALTSASGDPAALTWRDITAESIPPDFARTPRVHTLVRIEVGR
ncbi:MAG: bifunctional 23S rRNA (guanine(2069)-N(7))-methyltransferase RlmK/23S rRNA (guanine(2445)-N(2))-methyltransferase RlmL [Clostridiales bacterium]|nr:bifunctional 23S rRNA (guanine(2069)-N(7))-methyltransferase RlmK/23S rRNA (guanine(2445)-N(2))-methyltransferase RlmL [Clostridiales bacterium]